MNDGPRVVTKIRYPNDEIRKLAGDGRFYTLFVYFNSINRMRGILWRSTVVLLCICLIFFFLCESGFDFGFAANVSIFFLVRFVSVVH